jgi:hypothetical protein
MLVWYSAGGYRLTTTPRRGGTGRDTMSKKKRTQGKAAPSMEVKITQQKRDRVAAVLAVMLGLLSVTEGGRVLLGLFVPGYPVLPWLVWYNVGMGALSVAAGAGIWLQRERARSLAVNILTLHAIVFVGLFALKQMGQTVAMQSIFAMMFRTFSWSVIYSLVSWKRQEDTSRES